MFGNTDFNTHFISWEGKSVFEVEDITWVEITHLNVLPAD